MKSYVLTYVTVFAIMPGIVYATPINGGFETGDLTGWQAVGDASVQTASPGSGATQGTYQAVLTNDLLAWINGESAPGHIYPLSGLPAVLLDDAFFGLVPGSLLTITVAPFPEDNPNVRWGSGIKQSFFGTAGDQIGFEWNYLTNDGYNYDYSFVSMVSSEFQFLEKLAGNDPSSVMGEGNFPPPLVTSNTVFENETGFRAFSLTLPKTGLYTVGIGVSGVADEVFDSGIILDDFKVISVTEPSVVLLLGMAILGIVGLRWMLKVHAA